MSHHQRVAAVLYLIISSSLRAGDGPVTIEITDRDGKTLQGRLFPGTAGSLRLEADGAQWPLDRVRRLRFPRTDAPPLLQPVLHTIRLRDGQHVTGALLGMDGERLLIRTAWSELLPLPHGVVEKITHPSGWLPVTVEGFEGNPHGWTLTDDLLAVQGETTSGKRSLRLRRAGQSGTFRLAKPLAAGRVSINFHLSEKRGGGAWLAELSFGDVKKVRQVRIELDGSGKDYVAAVPGKASYQGAVPRTRGWHRLQAEFTAERLLLLIDDYVLWSGLRADVSGPLTACKFTCDKSTSGELLLDDFALSRAVPPPRSNEPGDPTQDAIVSLDGDESFGRIMQLSGLTITQKSIGREREHDWRSIREVRLRREGFAAKEATGEHVRVRMLTNDGGRDEIEGVVHRFDGSHLALQHAFLGELRFPVERLDEIRPLFRGRRMPIESAPRHLGLSLKARFAVVRGQGESLRWPLKLNSVSGPANLLIEAAHLPMTGPEVYVNDKRVADLARLVDRTRWESAWARVSLPDGLLTAGANTIELRLSADPDTGRARDCEIRSIRLELAQR